MSSANRRYEAAKPITLIDNTMSQPYRELMLDVTRYLPIIGTASPEGVIEALQYSVFIDQTNALIYRKMLTSIGGDITKGWKLLGIANGPSDLAYVAKTANYTVTDIDYMIDCTANSFTVTLPTAVDREGQRFNVKNTGTGLITVDADGSELIDDAIIQTLRRWDSITVMSDGAGWIIE